MPDDAISPRNWNVGPGTKQKQILCLMASLSYCVCVFALPNCSGGKQLKSRPGFFTRDGERVTQHFVYQEGPKTGEAKGLKVR